MYQLKTEAHFDAAHFLSGYAGKCRNIHGHRWKIEAVIESETLQNTTQMRGMVTDFSVFKEALEEIADSFDHTLIYEQGSLKPATLEALRDEQFRLTEVKFRPTAENLAAYFYTELKKRDLPVCEVAVYETPKNCAVYTEKG